MAARNRVWTPDIVRARIQESMIENRLVDHVHGRIEMSATQVTAALGLLRKVVPDLAAVQHSGSIGLSKAEELPDAVLADIATGSGEGIAETQDSQEIPSGIH